MQEQKYAATYKIGNSIVHIIAPDPNMPKEKIERIRREMREIGWEIWNELSYEEKLKINAEYENKKVEIKEKAEK
ncbi:hypothetical protein GOQ29_06965 [Clostridium sp. D2Q-14]|uniref:hypothetical protein n=1 Tax=Anaeromonas gelatinilytica TaxID=2683194 RepID=UPI00193BD4E5|nr:hypothetical protein [Anaeromonas gelatinilytica]MBS4535357.1 hypothetical protein [Anaeromonas gelatinilytica]